MPKQVYSIYVRCRNQTLFSSFVRILFSTRSTYFPFEIPTKKKNTSCFFLHNHTKNQRKPKFSLYFNENDVLCIIYTCSRASVDIFFLDFRAAQGEMKIIWTVTNKQTNKQAKRIVDERKRQRASEEKMCNKFVYKIVFIERQQYNKKSGEKREKNCTTQNSHRCENTMHEHS